MKIALVLSRPPGYSESFFNNKIRCLVQYGLEVELYVDQYNSKFDLCIQKPLPDKGTLNLMLWFLKSLILNPVRVIRFFYLELSINSGFVETFKRFYSCLHLINSKGIDWVHFGYATMAVGRETISTVLC
jgi:colanic acid/amylovoran biosynthesis glycosyltransferase